MTIEPLPGYRKFKRPILKFGSSVTKKKPSAGASRKLVPEVLVRHPSRKLVHLRLSGIHYA